MFGQELVEMPLEADGSLLLSTLQSQFPSASGLKYRNEETHAMRAVRMTAAGALSAPEDFWGERIYLIVGRGGDASGAVAMDDGAKRKADELHNDDLKKKRQQCYRCGGEGHIQEMCSSQEGSRHAPGPECHLCHGKGHIRARCPNQIPSGMCYRCFTFGHTGRECKNTFHGGSGGYGFGAQRHDFGGGHAHAHGHGPHSHAPHPHFGGGGGFGDRLCYRCHQPGHQAVHCPQTGPQGGLHGGPQGGPQGALVCYKCGTEGHMARNCDVCFNCKQSGHLAANCPAGGRA